MIDVGLFQADRVYKYPPDGCVGFEDCVLNVPLGLFGPGEKVAGVDIDLLAGTLTLLREDEEILSEHKISITLTR